MPKTTKTIILIGVGLLILILGFYLRYKNHSLVPLPGESTDEYSNSWVGLSLIQLGLPVGRSGLLGYGGSDPRYINVDRIYSTTAGGGPLGINQPWLDHPPLLPLISGGYAYLSGARIFEDAAAQIIRKPMLIIGVISVALVGVLTYQLVGTGAALLAMALFATSPLVTVTSRMIQGENGVSVAFLASLIFLNSYVTKRGNIFLWLSALAAGGALLFKVSGIAVAICGAIILLSQENKKIGLRYWETALFLTVALSFLALFFVYGAAFDWSTFVIVWQSNSTRPYDIGFGSLFDLLTTTKITVSKRLTEGWPLVGWISVFLLMMREKKRLFFFVVLPVLVYLVIFLLMGGSAYGWYRLPFMPFLFIAIAVILADGFSSADKLLPVLLTLIPLGMTIHKLSEAHRLAAIIPLWRYGLPAVIGWFLFGKKARLNRFLYITLILMALAANIWLDLSLTPEFYLKIN
ncbi:MAG: hypothetical protein A3I38_02405 [Candidatus Wildermuthbacteria bacterium RIFCSPLOWO2_02_FULL_47_10]|uniref:Glycosyltransferase RgtA/B/C/D-like domain-containing protein n=1 Tax=Candidatus Wildermuthbacteria bacterium RIFCSPHIGHO2_02_FULL_47_17 TaxID=1802452 RepID=A0A1G2R7D9_9BACT|nr:MAG: hypothetical protein A3D59_01040 [Candidatus Wildermuthbacteria bacterium RIFCSPHIGHO2_02_FULL_47_17]OHA75713.1 MAG: hypothetical protein A3I38_02405 [Candidatus Wildermuthbacteria bacterium RIFCSPLOWO2_02_FULL_47_10]